jgi:uncharacterized protein (TIGR03790 family)
MGLSKENVVVLYRQGDADSLAFARRYKEVRSLHDDQLIPVPCSASEVLADYATFQEEIENPLANKIFDPYFGRQVFAILVGYNVPGGFMHGPDIISTTSRLSRISHAFSPKTGNPLFDRQVFKFYDTSDSDLALIVSRIDAPSLDVALNALDATQRFIRQGSANGTFFFDKYFVASAFDAAESGYESDLLDFENVILPVLNMPTWKTTFWDEYKDVPVPQLKNDSFMWGWGADRAGYRFFEDTRTSRVFLYNADHDGAGTLRDPNDKRFPLLALSSGYVCTAGATSDPTTSGFLRPRPFFEALFRGASVGEAFYFACPHVDWTMTLFGDPLTVVKFPTGNTLDDGLTQDAAWDIMVERMSKAVAWSYKRKTDFAPIVTSLLAYTDQTKADLFSAFDLLQGEGDTKWASPYSKAVPLLLKFAAPDDGSSSPITAYLSGRQVKISDLLWESIAAGGFLSNYSFPQGYWRADYTIAGDGIEYTLFNFQLQVSLHEDFSSLLLNLNTAVSRSGWSYERNVGDFQPFPALGVSSSFIGRRVRFESPLSAYLSRGTVFYYRVRQSDTLNSTSAWSVFKTIVSS